MRFPEMQYSCTPSSQGEDMETAAGAQEVENLPGQPCDRETFRRWWSGYRRDLKMSEHTKHFAAAWWRDLPPSLRGFIALEAGLTGEAMVKAARGEFETLAAVDQERLMLVARDVLRDLKPVTWMG